MKVAYPASCVFQKLSTDLLALKIARHSRCSQCSTCFGMHPPRGVRVVLDENSDSSLMNLEQYGSDDDDDEEVSSYFAQCECGHDAKTHSANDAVLGKVEFQRRGRVAIRLDELLQDSGRLLDFDYTDDDILSLRKQLGHPVSTLNVATTDLSPLGQPSVPQTPISSDPSYSSPLHPNKKRRTSVSTLSENDAIANDDDDDDEEDKPLAERIPPGGRPPPGKRVQVTGNRAPGKRPRPGHGSHPSMSDSGSARYVNGRGATNGHTSRDTMDEAQLRGLTAGVPVDSAGGASAQPARAEKPSAVELRKGLIKIVPVENDRQPRNLIILTGLKTLFQRQLPKMPREYIARLVYDDNSRCLAIIKKGLKVVGGICYRPFPQRGFAEIVFFATNSHDQIKGYGGMLMDHFKAHIRNTYPDMWHFLTYADNYAVGYFEKQGFSKDIALDRSVWAGYIKDYEGGTIMQCTMLPKVDYLDKHGIFKAQTDAIMTKIRQLSKSHHVYPGLPAFQTGNPNVKLSPRDVPGLRETGWSEEMASLMRTKVKGEDTTVMEKIIHDLMLHPRAWPFSNPVKAEEVPDYYDVITEPMDFSTIQHKVQTDQYRSFKQFTDDVQLVFSNCKTYNPPTSIYAKHADNVKEAFELMLETRYKDRR